MSDLKPLETQLQSWTLRRPSPELKEKVFGASSATEAPAPKRPLVPTWNWLTPLAACCLTVLTLVKVNNGRLNPIGDRENHAIFAVAMTSLTVSNPTATFQPKWFGLSATDENLEWNVWSTASFDWTKEGQFLSTNRSLHLAQTNYLTR